MWEDFSEKRELAGTYTPKRPLTVFRRFLPSVDWGVGGVVGTKRSNPIWRVTGFSNTNQSTVGQTEERGHPHTQKEQGTKAGRGGTLGALSTAEPPSSVRGRGRRGTRRWEPTSAAAQPSDSGLSAGKSGGWGIAEAGLEKVRGPVRRPAVDQQQALMGGQGRPGWIEELGRLPGRGDLSAEP